MRAREFIQENRSRRRVAGEIPDHYYAANPGAITSSEMDRYYDMYRAGMLMGRAPADLDKVEASSWMNNRAYFGAYTQQERDKIEAAFRELGIPPEEIVPAGSEDAEGTNTQSPVKPFAGYPR